MDWGAGRYETIATGLAPAAEVLVHAAVPRPGELVVDVGCGTGSATVAAAAAGARVVGVDPAPRLLQVADAAARAAAVRAVAFTAGTAGALPVGAGTVDVVLSAFGVIFAPEPGAALADMARICAPTGRILLTAWLPEGALGELGRLRRGATAVPQVATAGPPFAWHDPDAVSQVLGPHGFTATAGVFDLAFDAPSPEAFLAGELRDHPMWVTARPELERRGSWDDVVEEARRILTLANEVPGGFRVTSRYAVVAARRR